MSLFTLILVLVLILVSISTPLPFPTGSSSTFKNGSLQMRTRRQPSGRNFTRLAPKTFPSSIIVWKQKSKKSEKTCKRIQKAKG